MNNRNAVAVAAAGMLLAGMVSVAQARTLGGVKLDDTMTVGGSSLKLNGMCIRKKFIVSVYVGALYLAAPAHKTEDVVNPNTGKALVMHFVHDVGHGKLVDAFKDGFEENVPAAQLKAVKADMDRFLAAIPDVDDGQSITFTYDPAKGSTITMPKGKTFTAAGKAFADAYLLVFLGPEPPTGSVKRGLLNY